MIASSPGRPRGFDLETVLDAVMDVFHAHGYGATTYGLLEQATGLRRQSLVYAFGDKAALFDAALERYADRRVETVLGLLRDTPDPVDGIRDAFALWLRDAADRDRPGCLLVNTAGETTQPSTAAAGTLHNATGALIAGFTAAFDRARSRGALAVTASADDLARMAVALGDGALMHARASRSPHLAEAGFRAFLTTVFPSPTPERTDP